jgi:hypothetical protein
VNWGIANTLMGMNYHPISKVIGWDVSNNFGAKFDWTIMNMVDSGNFSSSISYLTLSVNQDISQMVVGGE